MSHNNNNNNGGLHACVRAAEDIEPIRVTRAKYCALLPFSSSCCVRFLLLLSVCIQCASFMSMLCLFLSNSGEFQAPPIGLEYELKRGELYSNGSFGGKYS